MRKHLDKDNFGQFMGTSAIENAAEQLSKEYLAKFPDIDLDDLISILLPILFWAKTMCMLNEATENGLTTEIINQKRDG